MKILALILVVIGVAGLAWGGFSFTKKETAVDIGPIEITRDSRKSIPIPPVLGAVALIGGIALLVTAKK